MTRNLAKACGHINGLCDVIQSFRYSSISWNDLVSMAAPYLRGNNTDFSALIPDNNNK